MGGTTGPADLHDVVAGDEQFLDLDLGVQSGQQLPEELGEPRPAGVSAALRQWHVVDQVGIRMHCRENGVEVSAADGVVDATASSAERRRHC
jgi:hypothetical protein